MSFTKACSVDSVESMEINLSVCTRFSSKTSCQSLPGSAKVTTGLVALNSSLLLETDGCLCKGGGVARMSAIEDLRLWPERGGDETAAAAANSAWGDLGAGTGTDEEIDAGSDMVVNRNGFVCFVGRTK